MSIVENGGETNNTNNTSIENNNIASDNLESNKNSPQDNKTNEEFDVEFSAPLPMDPRYVVLNNIKFYFNFIFIQ